MVIVTVRHRSNCDRRAVSQGAWEKGQGKKGQHFAAEVPVHSLTSVAPCWILEREWP